MNSLLRFPIDWLASSARPGPSPGYALEAMTLDFAAALIHDRRHRNQFSPSGAHYSHQRPSPRLRKSMHGIIRAKGVLPER
jgi:hypothetical protein